MKKLTLTLFVAVVVLFPVVSAHAQFEPGELSIRPEFGLGISNTFGLTFGGSMLYGISEKVAFGPTFQFSTAGRKWESDGTDTKGSNSMAIAGRFYYLIVPESDYPWYVNGGIGIVKFGSISEYENDAKIQTAEGEDIEIKGATTIAVNFGTGSIFELGDNMNLVIDANSYIGSHGDRKGKTANQDDIDLNNDLEGGVFWILHTTVGLSFAF